MSPAELVLRGTAIYWFLFLLFRFFLRRDVGQLGVADVLLLVLIADAAQNGMAGGYESVTEAIVLVATIAGWNWLLDWLAFRFSAVARFVEPRTLTLIRHGRLIRDNMRQEMLTESELLSQLREQGVESISEVRRACLESDGHISVIRVRGGGQPSPQRGPLGR